MAYNFFLAGKNPKITIKALPEAKEIGEMEC